MTFDFEVWHLELFYYIWVLLPRIGGSLQGLCSPRSRGVNGPECTGTVFQLAFLLLERRSCLVWTCYRNTVQLRHAFRDRASVHRYFSSAVLLEYLSVLMSGLLNNPKNREWANFSASVGWFRAKQLSASWVWLCPWTQLPSDPCCTRPPRLPSTTGCEGRAPSVYFLGPFSVVCVLVSL